MDRYYQSGEPYGYGYPFHGQQDPSEYPLSPCTGSSIAMSRIPSQESTISACNPDQAHTPSSEYSPNGQTWFPTDGADQRLAFSPTGFNMATTSGTASDYVTATGTSTSTENFYGSNGSQSSWTHHFAPDVAAQTRSTCQPPEATAQGNCSSASVAPLHPNHYVCIEVGCHKSFKRKADRDRHIAQVHTPMEEKEKFPCDWKKCQRAHDPFGRNDHQREHYREFHAEDVMWRRPSTKNNSKFWATRKIYLPWWRCSRCLERVSRDSNGYTCPSCNVACEPERQRYRGEIEKKITTQDIIQEAEQAIEPQDLQGYALEVDRPYTHGYQHTYSNEYQQGYPQGYSQGYSQSYSQAGQYYG
ncbi:hypothetical protein GGS20DRAFT_36491 [Poronia punctata]|nr:hypothetical protein GGS20DRAFT_36491 [Poronia punctata]